MLNMLYKLAMIVRKENNSDNHECLEINLHWLEVNQVSIIAGALIYLVKVYLNITKSQFQVKKQNGSLP